ncbi:MAG: CotH kinase family protein [Lachnospiraceae bacterium]|nr:CotH kinase family protein [Lachnospiraceae bacterium]
MEYETALFDTDEVMEVDIRMDEDTWEAMLANAMSEEYYTCDVVINGERVNNVAICPKGNTSLSAIAMDTGTDLETYLNVDNVLKYMAVHTFSVNQDSLSGSMAHNYYLYEYEGQLDILPWDYNLSLGGMSMGSGGDATSVVNDPIDTPFSGTKFFNAFLENEEYLARYHTYLQELVDEYIDGGKFDEMYERIRGQIDELVEEDPTAFYPYDEYETAADYLYRTVKLRGESIKGQLAGTIPSTDAGQRQDSSALVDASDINISAMHR